MFGYRGVCLSAIQAPALTDTRLTEDRRRDYCADVRSWERTDRARYDRTIHGSDPERPSLPLAELPETGPT